VVTDVGCKRRRPSRADRAACHSVSNGNVRWRRREVDRTSHSSVRGSCPCTPDGSRSPVTSQLTCGCSAWNAASTQNSRSADAAKHVARPVAAGCLQQTSPVPPQSFIIQSVNADDSMRNEGHPQTYKSTAHAAPLFTLESSYCFQRILAIPILSVCLSVRHTGGSVKNGAS